MCCIKGLYWARFLNYLNFSFNHRFAGETRLHVLAKAPGNMVELQMLLRTGYSVNETDHGGTYSSQNN